MLAWFYRRARKQTHCCHCERIIHVGQLYIGRNTYGGIMAYCPSCCPDEKFRKSITDMMWAKKHKDSMAKKVV